jgi:arylsulfatase
LYNLQRDPGEQFDLAVYFPEKVAELMLTAEKARAELGDLNVGIEKGAGTREIGKLNK